jgi:hypothetical protein
MALASALKVVSVLRQRRVLRLRRLLGADGVDLLPAEAGRDDVLRDDAGARVDLDAAALAMGHAVAAAPHKGLLPDR